MSINFFEFPKNCIDMDCFLLLNVVKRVGSSNYLKLDYCVLLFSLMVFPDILSVNLTLNAKKSG